MHSNSQYQNEVSGQLHAPVALILGKEPPIPITEEVRWTTETV